MEKENYRNFDRSEVTQFLFHPRGESGSGSSVENCQEILIPVENDIVIGSRFYLIHPNAPTILFFHGNGEIVEDYDDIAQIYMKMNINFVVFDFRGYGRSSGSPSVTKMLQDAHRLFEYSMKYLKNKGYGGILVLMGRSLGSACALEIVADYSEFIDGLIIESGFAFSIPLLKLIGIDVDRIGLTEKEGIGNNEKVKEFNKPTLIIHAEFDHIIPFSDGQFLFDNSPAADKSLLKIEGANHNDIFGRGIQEYMLSIKNLLERIMNT